MKSYAKPELLVETDWLDENLDRDELRVFDCAAQPSPRSDEDERKRFPVEPKSGRPQYEKQHIPGAGFIDLPVDLTDKTSPIPMMMPSVDQAIDVITRAGIGDGTRVILYSSTNPMWATRVWWVLRAIGFDNAAILNGGFQKWLAENRETSSEVCQYKASVFTAKPRSGVFIDKHRVREAIDEVDTLLIHALTPPVYAGKKDALVFGRRGRIPGSVNIPSYMLHDSETGVYLASSELHKIFTAVESDRAGQIITYCGGGINASNDAFALALLGYDNVAIYDGSMNEWGNDVSLPIEI